MIKTININDGEIENLYQYLSAAVTPRPIALVSTVDSNGKPSVAAVFDRQVKQIV